MGTPFLYKPSRILGAMGTKNNQETIWYDTLDADNFDVYRPGMDGCFQCPIRCRPLNDLTPEGKGGWGADAMKGVTGNAGYDERQAGIGHLREKSYKGIRGDGAYDRHDKGDGPDYVTLGKMGPMIGIREPEQVLRLNNIVNDLGLDSASTGSAIAWAMELYQRGIITAKETGGLDLTWGNYEVIEKLLYMTSRREGFGDVIADSARAVERGRYPAEALKYRMAVKGLFQSDPHDARIIKGFALGLAVSTRGMDHLRNRPTLEINAKINDNPEFKTALYGGTVAPEPTSYEGKEHAVAACEKTFAVGDAVGICRFATKLFNSPSTADYNDFALQLKELTGEEFTPAQLDEIGRNITGIERLINARLGLTEKDDTLPDRWFEEEITAGPFTGREDRPGRVRGAEGPLLLPARAERRGRAVARVASPPRGSDHGIRREGHAPRGDPGSPGRGGHRRSARVRRRRTPGGAEEAASPRGPETGRQLPDRFRQRGHGPVERGRDPRPERRRGHRPAHHRGRVRRRSS